jgi:hypothetical protein
MASESLQATLIIDLFQRDSSASPQNDMMGRGENIVAIENYQKRRKRITIMAVIAMFYGIIVSMYYFDTRQHHRPHSTSNTKRKKWFYLFPKVNSWEAV